jgi:hypothetical protein
MQDACAPPVSARHAIRNLSPRSRFLVRSQLLTRGYPLPAERDVPWSHVIVGTIAAGGARRSCAPCGFDRPI